MIFTNVALTDDGDVWWEGLTDTPPDAPDRLARARTGPRPPARPPRTRTRRFTVAADQCPTIADSWDSPEGVPIDAILFGGRRATNVPLVAQARDWAHGVFLGATIASEQTAAAEGPVGALRRDPFAMLPFCGYNMADHWAHWLRLGARLSARGVPLPAVFGVNWFRKGADGRYLWPGFGENSRVLGVGAAGGSTGRCDGRRDSPVGAAAGATATLDLDGLDLPAGDARRSCSRSTRRRGWRECDLTEEFFARFGDRLPVAMVDELDSLRKRLRAG